MAEQAPDGKFYKSTLIPDLPPYATFGAHAHSGSYLRIRFPVAVPAIDQPAKLSQRLNLPEFVSSIRIYVDESVF